MVLRLDEEKWVKPGAGGKRFRLYTKNHSKLSRGANEQVRNYGLQVLRASPYRKSLDFLIGAGLVVSAFLFTSFMFLLSPVILFGFGAWILFGLLTEKKGNNDR